MTGSIEFSRQLAVDYTTADLTPADRAMLDYAVRLSLRPLHAADAIDGLRAVGFDDRAILDICQVAAYYNYVNRLADGLGVELEPYWDEADMTMTPGQFHDRVAHRESSGAG